MSFWNRSKKQNLDEKMKILDGIVRINGITLGDFGSEKSGYDTMMDFVRDFKILKKALLESENLDEARQKVKAMDKILKKLQEPGLYDLDLDDMYSFEQILNENLNNFGNRRRRRKVSKKPSVSLKKLCKKHKIRLSVKRGSKRVPKSEKVLKKQLANKLKKKKTVKRRRKRRSGYGSSLGMGPYPGSLMMRPPYFEMMKKA